MNTQETFNTVIESGLYHYYELMCCALIDAGVDGIISEEERRAATQEINYYLKGFVSLRGKLVHNDLPDAFEDRLAIYQDWANKPVLK